MAKVVDEMPGSNTRYPWDEWFDGRSWELTRGTDYSAISFNFRTTVYAAARQRNLKVKVTLRGENTVFVKAHLGEGDTP